MDFRTLKQLPRTVLQKLARREKIKANGKSEEIIQRLIEKHPAGVPNLESAGLEGNARRGKSRSFRVKNELLEDELNEINSQNAPGPSHSQSGSIQEDTGAAPVANTQDLPSQPERPTSNEAAPSGEEAQGVSNVLSSRESPAQPQGSANYRTSRAAAPVTTNEVADAPTRVNAAIQTDVEEVLRDHQSPSSSPQFVRTKRGVIRGISFGDWMSLMGKTTPFVDTAPAISAKILELQMLREGVERRLNHLDSDINEQRKMRIVMEKHYFAAWKDNKALWDGSRGRGYYEHGEQSSEADEHHFEGDDVEEMPNEDPDFEQRIQNSQTHKPQGGHPNSVLGRRKRDMDAEESENDEDEGGRRRIRIRS